MKILVAIPVYDGKLQVEVVRCLLQEQLLGAANGDEVQFLFLPSCSHAAMGRNQLANDFLASDADRLIFLDADVSFERGAILKLAHRKEDLVGGAYRYKLEEESYPVGWLPDPEGKGLQANESGLLEVAALPGGFLSISRRVFEVLKAWNPRPYEHFGKKYHCFFEMAYRESALYGEDSGFCKDWREAGGKVFLDPELSLTHWEFNRPYAGHVGKWLRGRSQKAA